MMSMELDHIGIAVGDVASMLEKLHRLLEVRPYKAEIVEEDGVKTHFIRSGAARLELLEALREDSPIAKFVARRGEGLHHLAFEVDDLDATYRRLKEGGFELIDEAPRRGADGKRIFFVHPRSTGGLLIELCQTDRSVLRAVEALPGLWDAGSSDRTPLVWATSDRPEDRLVRFLEPQFYLIVADFDALGPAWSSPPIWQHVTGDRPVHLVADGANAENAASLAANEPDRIRSLVMMRPGRIDARPNQPVLIIARDDGDPATLSDVREALPNALLAILPYDDVTIVARLIEMHIRRTEAGV